MSAAELQDQISRYLAESRVRELSPEEQRRWRELVQTPCFEAVPQHGTTYDVVRIDVVTPLVREFARTA